jgi:hypothetical protein
LAVPTDKDPQITNSNVQGFKIEKQEPRLSEPFKINLVETSGWFKKLKIWKRWFVSDPSLRRIFRPFFF